MALATGSSHPATAAADSDSSADGQHSRPTGRMSNGGPRGCDSPAAADRGGDRSNPPSNSLLPPSALTSSPHSVAPTSSALTPAGEGSPQCAQKSVGKCHRPSDGHTCTGDTADCYCSSGGTPVKGTGSQLHALKREMQASGDFKLRHSDVFQPTACMHVHHSHPYKQLHMEHCVLQ